MSRIVLGPKCSFHTISVTYPLAYDPGPELCDHLEFALKHEGVSLGVLAALFRAVEVASFEPRLCGYIKGPPSRAAPCSQGRATGTRWRPRPGATSPAETHCA
jgi:hypothetical protein